MTPDRSHSDTVVRVANKVRVEGGLFRNIVLLTHFLRQRFFFFMYTSNSKSSGYCKSSFPVHTAFRSLIEIFWISTAFIFSDLGFFLKIFFGPFPSSFFFYPFRILFFFLFSSMYACVKCSSVVMKITPADLRNNVIIYFQNNLHRSLVKEPFTSHN